MKSILIVLVILALPVSSAGAFDGELKGLVAGGGLGFGMSMVDQDINGASLGGLTRFGPAYDLRIGVGASESIALLLSLRGSWIRYDTQRTDNSDVLHGTLGIGMVQYFKNGRSKWYSTGQLGVAYFSLVEEDVDALTGFGFAAGLGYQWRQHLGAEVLIGYESTDTQIDTLNFGNSAFTVRVQVVAVAY